MTNVKPKAPSPLPERISDAELGALPDDLRSWVMENQAEIREWIEETDRVVEDWIAEGSPTPKTLEEARQMYLERNFPERVPGTPSRHRES